MKFKMLVSAASSVVLLCVSALANSTMQLLTPTQGWAIGGHKQLFWSEDNGRHWSNITPSEPPGSSVADVFFLDTSRGWVLLEAAAGDDRLRFELATTADAGHTWSRAPVSVPNQYSSELSGGAWVDFVDAEHGWIAMRRATSSAFSMGRLLTTQDGGKTWNELPQTPFGAPVLFASSTDGWAIDDFGGGGFYQTHDGGKTWDDVALQYPETMRAAYSSLHFRDARHCSVAVILSPIPPDEKDPSNLVLFTTEDGKSWKRDRELTLARNMYGESAFPSILTDSTLISILPGLTLTTVGLAGVPNSKPINTVKTEASEVSFATSAIGWVRTRDDKLLSTTDGGERWTWLVPGSAPRELPTAPPETPRVKPHKISSRPLTGSLIATAEPATPVLHYTERLGFDKHEVWPVSTNKMSTWWASSPFFDVGFYVGGANYCYSYNSTTKTCTIRLDPGVTSGWVTQQTNQGWGLMPIWVGEQAPCNTGNVTVFSSNPATAQSEGGIEALSAANAMTALGLSGTVVFYDMESYSAAAGSTCSLAVRAFLTGWVNGMNANGFPVTGVYGNSGPAQRDFSQVANLTEAWITQVSVNGNNSPQVTIWSLGSGQNALADNWWNNSQRGHQYLIDAAGINYGGVAASIDFDVESFQIPGGSGTKPYSFAVAATVNVQNESPYFAGTGGTGMNDVINDSNGMHFVTKGQVGEVVGFFETSPPAGGVCNSSCFESFIYNNGSLTSFLDPNSIVYTLAYGINDAGQAVGYYCYGTYKGYQGDIFCSPPGHNTYTESGFLGSNLLGGQSFADIDYSSNIFTYPLGINDGGLVVGQAGGYNDGTPAVCALYWNFGSYGDCTYTFFYQNGDLTPASLSSCPGQASLLTIMGMNGFNQLVGYYYDASGASHGFVYSAPPAGSQGCSQIDVGPTGSNTYLAGINNQGQVIGSYISPGQPYCWFFIDSLVAYYTGYEMWNFNDATQITGYNNQGVNGCGGDDWKPSTFIVLSPI
jgi:photosystem II stability/assembly factor-like uncharacterized protein